MDAVETTIAEIPVTRRPRLNAEGRIAQINSKIENLWAEPEPDVVKIALLEKTKEVVAAGAAKKNRQTEPGAELKELEALAEYMRRVAVSLIPLVPKPEVARILRDAKGANWNGPR